MRKRFYHERVCSCSPVVGMKFIEARMLKAIVNREIHPIRCASTCGRKGQKALMLGNLCVEAGYPLWALKIWWFAINEIHNKDYDDWVDAWFDNKYVSLQDVISDGLCEMIGRRIDEINRKCGLDDSKGRDSCEYWCGDGWYDSFRYEKYDNDINYWVDFFTKMRDEAVAQQTTDRIFREGQGYLPPQAQDFFYYWEDFDPTVQNLYFKIDDWD